MNALQSDGTRGSAHTLQIVRKTTSLKFSTSLAAGHVLAKKTPRFSPRQSTPNGDANTSAGHERPWRNAGGLVLDLSPVPVRYPHYEWRLTLVLFFLQILAMFPLSITDFQCSLTCKSRIERVSCRTRVVYARGEIESR